MISNIVCTLRHITAGGVVPYESAVVKCTRVYRCTYYRGGLLGCTSATMICIGETNLVHLTARVVLPYPSAALIWTRVHTLVHITTRGRTPLQVLR